MCVGNGFNDLGEIFYLHNFFSFWLHLYTVVIFCKNAVFLSKIDSNKMINYIWVIIYLIGI